MVSSRPLGPNVDAVIDCVNFFHQILVDFLKQNLDEVVFRFGTEQQGQYSDIKRYDFFGPLKGGVCRVTVYVIESFFYVCGS